MVTARELVGAGAALADRFGTERADAFGQALPGVVAELEARWGVRVETLFESGASSVVLAVSMAARGPAVLKVSPDTEFVARQATMLVHLGPTGRVPRVLEHDEQAGAVLMERILPGDTVGASRHTLPSPESWAELLRDLHGTGTTSVTDRLADRCEEMIERIGARQAAPAVRTHVPDDLWHQAVAQCRDLVATARDDVAIHGDLHLGNVLDAGPRGLVAIDPKLCVGDRCYDLMDFVIAHGGPDEMAARSARMAALTGVDPDRLLRWCQVDAVVTGVTRLARSGPDSWTDALLAFARQA